MTRIQELLKTFRNHGKAFHLRMKNQKIKNIDSIQSTKAIKKSFHKSIKLVENVSPVIK